MTPEAQRAAIAEACGWKHARIIIGALFGVHEKHEGNLGEIPDYLTDLNAMHEAEKAVPYAIQPILIRELKRVVMNYEAGVSDWDIYTSTAAQRAEAFLRTLGKWEEAT